ncbi:MAG TPA: potassium transporter [Bacteroidetes bacterium]|nr:potassium transporter [Bacteroidota bacterium]HCN38526.1 potassium transporter [Bacteroidota bacterium]
MENSFFFQAFIYLLSAVVMVPIAKKLGLGSVLGYLLAGIIIGPSLLGFIGQEGEDIMHFAEFGVVMMLFLIGLELEPELLWKLRKSILGMGGLQVILTALITGIAAFIIGLQWNQSVAIGLILAMSSTAIVMQTLNEKGLFKTDSGQSSFSVLLFQDIAVIPILALMPLLVISKITGSVDSNQHHSETLVSTLPGWLQTIAVLGAVAFVIFLGRLIAPPIFRAIAKTRLRELFTATALLLVIGITVLMTQVGLSPALGTFLAGVVLANSEYRHELESDIEPFKGLLLGLFFIAVGASIDFNLISNSPLTIVSLVLGIMAIKLLVLFIIGKLFKMSLDQNFLFSIGLCQIGEFAFVLLSFTSQEGIFDDQITKTMMAVVAITMGITPLLMLINEKFILTRVGTTEKPDEKEDDKFEEKNPVIIAGFGRFGNIIGRFLNANGIKTTVLDIDSDRVELLRKMGIKVYYGDASRYDLLKSAGAESAKVIIVCLDSAEKNLEIVDTVKKHYPHLHILVRAHDRFDAYDLLDAGMLHIYRETLDTSMRTAVDAMKLLGFRAFKADRLARKFLKHDDKILKDLASVRNDNNKYIDTVRERNNEMEEIIKADIHNKDLRQDDSWDAETLREEVRNNKFN